MQRTVKGADNMIKSVSTCYSRSENRDGEEWMGRERVESGKANDQVERQSKVCLKEIRYYQDIGIYK